MSKNNYEVSETFIIKQSGASFYMISKKVVFSVKVTQNSMVVRQKDKKETRRGISGSFFLSLSSFERKLYHIEQTKLSFDDFLMTT